jgi:hypothetical protein
MRALVVFVCLVAAPVQAEFFIDLGASQSEVETKIATMEKADSTDSSLHLGLGVRRNGQRGDFGVRVELDTIDSDLLFAVRALDYRRHVSERFAIGAFFGAARLDLATPAYGYYLGGGVHIKEIWPRWDLGMELRFGDEVARDNLLPSDPQGGSPDNFYEIAALSLYLSYRF